MGAYLQFDPQVLEVVDLLAQPAQRIEPNPRVFERAFWNEVDNQTGTIDFSAGRFQPPFLHGKLVAATIRFRARAITEKTEISFVFRDERKSSLARNGIRIMTELHDSTVQVIVPSPTSTATPSPTSTQEPTPSPSPSLTPPSSETAHPPDPPPMTETPSTQPDVACSPITLTGVANLIIELDEATDPVGEGNELVYTLTITNTGPHEATDVRLTSVLFPEVELAAVIPTQGGCSSPDGVAICSVGELVGNAAMQITIVAMAPAKEGRVVLVATVLGEETDPDLENNTVRENTTITGERGKFVYLPLILQQG
ncbi:MAG: DUF11 domain-containing protein [Chloroflexaceae bacterium]|nr:DUF11 domain-containing protein [Chloroflexaceae bacterium]